MAKVTLTDPTILSPSLLSTITSNNTRIENAIENTLSRDGTSPNTMESDLDMNSNRIINLPDAVDDHEPVTLSQLNDAILGDYIVSLPDGSITDAKISSSSKLYNRINDTVWVSDYGAVGDYIIGSSGTNSTEAIQEAMTVAMSSGKGVVRFPAGTFLVTSTLTSSPLLLVGEPGKTTIVFKNMSGSNGITFSASSSIGQIGGVIGIEFVAEGANLGIGVSCPKDSSQYETYFTRYIFRDVYCRGANRNTSAYSYCWDYSAAYWIRVGDCVGADLSNITIQGNYDIKSEPTAQFTDAGILLDASSALLTARISDLYIGPIKRGVVIGDRSFFSIRNFDLIGTYEGIIQTGTVVYSEPKIQFGNINAQYQGIYISNSDARDITSVTIRRHKDGYKSGLTDWYGIRCSDVDQLRVTGCSFQPDTSNGSFGNTSYAINLSSSGAVIIDSNLFLQSLDYAVLLNDCAGVEVKDNTLGGSSGVYVRLTNNSRRVNISKPSISNGSATYTMLSDDGSIDYSTSSLDDLVGIKRVSSSSASVLTISGGVVTATQSFHYIANEGAAASDDLDTITASSYMTNGTLLYLRPSSSSQDVVVTESGNIKLSAATVALSHTDDWLTLVYDNSVWKQVNYSDNTA